MSNIPQQYVYPENNALTMGVLDAAHSYCKIFLRCEQTNTDDQINNLAAGGSPAIRNTTYSTPLLPATLWANAGAATVGKDAATTGQFCTMAAGAHELDLTNNSAAWVFRLKKTAAAVADDRDIIASGDITTVAGYKLMQANINRTYRFYVHAGGGLTNLVNFGTDSISDGATPPPFKTLVVLYPRNNTSSWYAVNGTEIGSGTTTNVWGRNISPAGNPLYIGQGLTLATRCLEYQIQQFSMYQFPANMPSLVQRAAIYNWVQCNPQSPIPNKLFIPS